jgi:peroxiredoxin
MDRKRALFFFVSFLTLFLLVGTGGAQEVIPEELDQAGRAIGDIGIQPGNLAPSFELINLTDHMKSLKSFEGKTVLLNFWSTWCVPCRREMPSMEALHRDLAPKGLTVVAVSINTEPDSKHACSTFAKELDLTFPILLDMEQDAADAYRVHGIPVTYVIDPLGFVRARVFGEHDWSEPRLRRFIENLLPLTPEMFNFFP